MSESHMVIDVLHSEVLQYLDNQVHKALVFIAGDRRVRPDHQSPVHLSRQIHMLSCTRAHTHKGKKRELIHYTKLTACQFL